jgi:chaperonin cofactor prefoldin
LTGFLFDLDQSGIGATFLDDVSKTLTPGKAAVVAEVEESWTSPVDTRVHKLGGTVFRRLRSEVVEDQLVRESAAFETDLKALEDDLNRGITENRAAIQKDIEQTKKQIKVTQDQAKARVDQAKAEMDARIKSLQDQAKGASDRAKARIEKRIAELQPTVEAKADRSELWKAIRRVRAFREAQGLTLKDVSERCGIDVATLSKLENGKQANPTLFTMLLVVFSKGRRLEYAAKGILVTPLRYGPWKSTCWAATRQPAKMCAPCGKRWGASSGWSAGWSHGY